MVIETDDVTPRVWILSEHEEGKLTCLGHHIHKIDNHRHSHLDQVRDFAGHSLVKTIVEAEDVSIIQSALDAVGA